jgi:hypothetical protein
MLPGSCRFRMGSSFLARAPAWDCVERAFKWQGRHIHLHGRHLRCRGVESASADGASANCRASSHPPGEPLQKGRLN